MLFGLFAKIADDAGDQLFKPVPATEDFCAGKSAAGQVRFEGLDQASLLFSFEIALDGCSARVAVHAALAIRGSPLFEVEHRSADGNRFATKRELGELDFSPRPQHRDRAARRSEIDAEIDLPTIA